MRRIRVIPILLIDSSGGLIKTIRFGKRTYIGDPINALKIFNDKGVDELVLLDIDATPHNRKPNNELIEDIVSEAFMPVAYGGGIRDIAEMKLLLRTGVEKVIFNTQAWNNRELIKEAANQFGSQSIVVSIDVKNQLLGKRRAYCGCGSMVIPKSPLDWAKECETLGAGEIILTSISNEGTYRGYDLELCKVISSAVGIPVVANGGACSMDDFCKAVTYGGCSAVAASSIFIYAGQKQGVLIRFPLENELENEFWQKVDIDVENN